MKSYTSLYCSQHSGFSRLPTVMQASMSVLHSPMESALFMKPVPTGVAP